MKERKGTGLQIETLADVRSTTETIVMYVWLLSLVPFSVLFAGLWPSVLVALGTALLLLLVQLRAQNEFVRARLLLWAAWVLLGCYGMLALVMVELGVLK